MKLILALVFQDDKLRKLVLNVGPNDWKYIAGFLPVSVFTSMMRDSLLFCQTFVHLHINVSIKSVRCFIIKNRSEHQCQHRWFKVLDPDLVKGPWTKEEDEKVCFIYSYAVIGLLRLKIYLFFLSC